MSHHGGHGECDVESKGTGKASGSKQLAGGAYDDRAGIYADGSEHTPYVAHSGGIQEGWSSRTCHGGHRGRRAPNTISEATKAAVLHLARTRYAGTNHTHMSELLREHEGIDIARGSLRRLLVSAGENSPRGRRPPKHRVRRQRMPREGMLIQIDGSHHRWLGGDGP